MTTGTTLCLLVVLLPSAVVLASPSDPVFGDAATLAPLDGAPADVLVADLDGDGDDDLLICGPGPVYWLEHGVSGWTGRDLVTTTTEDFGDCSSAAVADIDRDGRLDVAYSGPTDAYLLYGRDDGEWDAEALPALYQAATTLAFADLEPNGTLDLFVGRSDESRVRYRLNDGTRGTWSTPDDNVTGVIFGDMAIADIDGNGLVEVIVDDDDFLATYAETTIGWRSVTEPAPVVFDHFRLGDLDGDGDLDAVVGGLFGLGAMWTIDGALQAGGSQISDARGNTFALADIDQDGRVGVLHADRDGVLRLNRPALDGTWSERVFGTLSSEPSVLAALDADRDGDLDIIAADGSAIYQYENRTPAPASTWARADDLPGTYTSPEFATAADFDGDGDVDVLTTGVAGSGTVLLENLGAGDFAEPVEVNAVALVGNGTPADFDGDGDIDVAGVADDGIYWLNNDGAPPWSSERVSTATGALLASADLDADADVDLAVGVVATGLVSWLRNDDFATTFTELVIDDTRDALGAIAVGDLYDDGTLDIVVTQVDEGVAALVWYDGGGSWVRGMGPTLDAVATGLLIADADADGATEVAIHSAAQGSALYAPQLSDRAAPWTLELSRTIQTWAPRYAFFGDADRDGRPDWLGVSEGRQLLRFVTTTTLAGSPIDTLPGIAAFAVADLDDDGDVDFLFASTDEDAVGVRWNQRRTAPVSQFVFAAPLVSRARPDRTYVQTYVSFRNEGSADDAAIALSTVGLRATLGGEPLPPETLESWLDVTVWRDDLDFDFDPESDEPFPATYSGAADGVARFTLTDPPVIWAAGSCRLLDFGPDGGRPVLVVPSLVNRHYILDLDSRTSLMRYLAARGLRSFLVDWGAPGDEEAGFSLDDYIAGRLGAAVDAVLAAAGAPPVLLGYCMGGNLGLALAVHRPGDLAGLALLATPWDFHAEAAHQARALAAAFQPVWPYFKRLQTVPVDLLQSLFAALDPQLALRKFTAFARLDPDSPEAERFVALEDWLNDGVALTTPVARDCIMGWYGANSPARGEWSVAGRTVEPGALRLPALVVVPAQDRIVPPGSALALAEAMPQAVVRRPALGHIGMVVSLRARRSVWGPLARWIEEA